MKQVNKILVIRFSSLGDLILTTPFFKNLKKNFPGSFVYFLTKKSYSSVFENNPYIDRFIFLEDKNFFEILREIRKIKIDIIFDLHNSLRSFIIKLFFPFTKSYTVNKRIGERRKILRKKQFIKIPHSKDWFLEILEKNNLKVFDRNTEIFLNDREIEKARNFLIEKGIKEEKIVVCFLDARWKNKELKIEKWKKIIEGLAGPFLKIILLGENEEKGKGLLSEIEGKYKAYVLNLTGKLSLREVFSIVKLSFIVLTSDSAGTHIANALNIPCLVFFGPTVKEFGFYPYREEDIIIEKDLSCRPCHLHGGDYCKRKDRECLNIDEKEVIRILKKKLRL